jgi:hypothetical protein
MFGDIQIHLYPQLDNIHLIYMYELTNSSENIAILPYSSREHNYPFITIINMLSLNISNLTNNCLLTFYSEEE